MSEEQQPSAPGVEGQSEKEKEKEKEKEQEQEEAEAVCVPQEIGPSSPLPLVKHDEVVANRDLFFKTLNQFHFAVGSKYQVPTIGGKELDLHRLYVEVTARGGLSKVIKDRKWKEIIGIFNFPPTTTSASFSLRKYYVSLLKAYEQVYFFQAQVDPTSSVDQPVTGVIDGKFEHGYFVTVKMGADILRGVLYHVPSGGSGVQHADISYFQSSNTFDTTTSGLNARRKKQKERIRRDPDHPKPNRSGYNFFFAEQHARLKALHPDKDRELSKMIGELWNKLTEEERVVYQDFGLKDKERYKREMQEYKQKLKGSHISEVSSQQVMEIWNSDDHMCKLLSPVAAEQED
ncbi:high mobility group B protein 15 isoform X4 [Cryptomeria japonica]|uniref:high mobility group B protein 15 isoform X4 n=1 Tax=Cryptomeria japonica TaxID=3369 RepID=UPI0025ACDF1E|nr:high mobility group B protein 15 isoform X4 [Cryptomeria japonica]